MRGSDYFTPIKILSVSLWFLLMLNLGTHLVGSIALLLVVGTFIIASLLSLFWFETHKEQGDDSENSKTESGDDPMDSVMEKGIKLQNLKSTLSLDCEEDDSMDGRETQIEMKEESTLSFLSGETDSKQDSMQDPKKDSKQDSVKTKKSSLKKILSKQKKSKKGNEDDPEQKPRVSFDQSVPYHGCPP